MIIRGLLLALVASAAHAGTVTAVTFGDARPSEVVVANGVEARATAGFVEYRHGTWSPRTVPIAPMPVGPIVAVSTVADADAVGNGDRLGAVQAASSCTLQAPAAHRELAGAAAAGRSVYWPLIRNAECRHALPPGLLDAVVFQESRYRPYIVSRAGAGGLTQLMPRTATELGVVDRFEPAANIDGGARYLRSMLDHYRSVPLALAAYNAGRDSVDRWGGIPLNGETPAYVAKVLGFFNEGDRGAATVTPSVVSYIVSLTFGAVN